MKRHVDLKERLKQLRAQQADIIDYTHPNPPPALEQLKSVKAAIAAHGGRATNHHGEPYPDVVDALEAYVAKARQEIGWPDRLELVDGWLNLNAPAVRAFWELVAAGADPCALGHRLREWIWSERCRWYPASPNAPQIRELASRARRLALNMDTVYEEVTLYWRRSFFDSPGALLGKEADWLEEVANSLNRVCGDQMPALTAIQQHLVDRTGARHDELLAKVLNSLHPTGRKATARSLAKRFARHHSQKARHLPEAVRERMLLGGMMEPLWLRHSLGREGVPAQTGSGRPESKWRTTD